MGQRTFATLSSENLLHNLAVVRSRAPHSKIMAMIKANAYGHGLRSVGLRLDGKVDALGVASIDEALALRKVGVKASIVLIEGVFTRSELVVAAVEKFHVVFHQPIQLKWLQEAKLAAPLTVWLKIYTGMGRLGFTHEAAQAAFDVLSHSSSVLKPIGIMSHFACSDEPLHALNDEQAASFKNFTDGRLCVRSLCNSAAIFKRPEDHYEWIRPGLALYGASPVSGMTAASFDLRPVMTFQTRLISVQKLSKGASVGYGARYICPSDMPIGIIAAGYGDGYPRNMRDGTPLLIKGIKTTLVGRISMDMAAIDLRPCPDAAPGDIATLWGQGLPVEEVALGNDHIGYDLLTGVQNRVETLWTSSFKEEDVEGTSVAQTNDFQNGGA